MQTEFHEQDADDFGDICVCGLYCIMKNSEFMVCGLYLNKQKK